MTTSPRIVPCLGRAGLLLALMLVGWALTVRGQRPAEPPPAAAQTEVPATEPEALVLANDYWFERVYEGGERTTPLTARAPSLRPAWERTWTLPIDLPEGNEFFCQVEDAWGHHRQLRASLRLPDDFPREASTILLWVKDRDDLWLHAEVPLPKPDEDGRVDLVVPVFGPAAEALWQARGHRRPWHQRTPFHLKEYGLKVAAKPGQSGKWSGELELLGFWLEGPIDRDTEVPALVREIRWSPVRPVVGERVQLSLQLTQPYHDPFDKDNVDLHAEITRPDGETETVALFYYEDFLFDATNLYSRLIPRGFPEFRLRYTPTEPGAYRVKVGGWVGGRPVDLPPKTFEAAANPDWPGFVRTSTQDRRLLIFDRGGEFWGQGLNVRSPYDTRYMASFPFSRWEDYNLNMYRQLLKKYGDEGINVVEVWMSPWWLALEWMPDAPGNHGVGYMNPYRSWMLDRIFDWAEEEDIHVILVFNNHGKFSDWIDQDWPRSPFNVARGGWLDNPSEYFSDARARRAFERFADYVVARWGYSDQLLAWKLFTEIDLTGDKGSNRSWFTDPRVAQWHQRSAAYLKEVDPNKHLVTTHWATSYKFAERSPALANLKELDFLTLDIYYDDRGGAPSLFRFMQDTTEFGVGKAKPWIITEFGGSPHGDTIAHIRNQLHIGLWAGFFYGHAATPCFWWFPLVEEQDLYGEFRSLARFTKGARRSGARVNYGREISERLTRCDLLRGDGGYVWVFDHGYYFAGELTQVAPLHEGVELDLSELPPGEYDVEVWDCRTGRIVARPKLDILPGDREGSLLPLPPFRFDVALKIRARGAPAEHSGNTAPTPSPDSAEDGPTVGSGPASRPELRR